MANTLYKVHSHLFRMEIYETFSIVQSMQCLPSAESKRNCVVGFEQPGQRNKNKLRVYVACKIIIIVQTADC